MDGKRIEEREALKQAVESLDAPPVAPPDQAAHDTAASTLPDLPPEEIERLRNDIVAALKSVYDPEIPSDIYELGLIYKIEIDSGRHVTVDMTLTAPGCPVAGEMPVWVDNAVSAVPGVAGTTVNLVFDPPWDQSRMSDEAKLAVGMF